MGHEEHLGRRRFQMTSDLKLMLVKNCEYKNPSSKEIGFCDLVTSLEIVSLC
jgi:hypothetical protein